MLIHTVLSSLSPRWGFRACEDIHAGDIIIEYVGEVIDDAMARERLENSRAAGDPHVFMMELDDNFIMDAKHKGNNARFINHSCNPNAQLEKWAVKDRYRIAIAATKMIKKGAEVTYDYQVRGRERTRRRERTPEEREERLYTTG